MKVVAAATLVFVGLMAQAQAALITVDYNGVLPDTYAPEVSSFSGSYEGNKTDSVSGVRLSPFASSTYFGRAYDAVETGTATYSAAAFGQSSGALGTFSFVLGSPDSYNTLSFSYQGKKVDSFSASDLGSTSQSGYEFVRLSGLKQYDSVTIGSSSAAAEFAAVSTVPLPPALPMFGGALLVLAAFGYRRKRREHGLPALAA